MLQLEPGEYFGIARQLPDPSDAETYYVQAVIRNARTDALIDTVNLTDRGNRRFSGEWQVTSKLPPNDALYVAIITSVYTDAAYSVKSTNYGETMETYLVSTRHNSLGGYGGGVSYETIRKIVDEAIDKKIVAPTPVDLSGLKEGIIRLESAIEAVKGEVEGTKGAMGAIQVNPAVDLGPVVSEIRKLRESVEEGQKTSREDWQRSTSIIIRDAEKNGKETAENIADKVRAAFADVAELMKAWMHADSENFKRAMSRIEETASGSIRSPFMGMSPAEAIRKIMKP